VRETCSLAPTPLLLLLRTTHVRKQAKQLFVSSLIVIYDSEFIQIIHSFIEIGG
jgi:hypothetical protein